ncbi:hypothetical protein PC129_g12622 [Phytophthora cactorum]|uniref:Uncharacterized protein n=1 Tax=Phytophthora cactorum TaxID=29920 RepID=A0A329S1K4_9STRA|nr:hypothetical protein Pcac1_g10824 [Phytophthora cactorum]KAG2815705.1 hypothetical protein PC112_g13757 [Phytophthora cactorum]KAG2853183.1 hypothetical protein PC113_g14381 [Phytophthora cactorum]KAG2909855.1 hypothetical protein PC115_g13121 [Phytophthora cactorum]KAG3006066.1 hypothetical protein PC119_g15084 [Phytophthora cactorum]
MPLATENHLSSEIAMETADVVAKLRLLQEDEEENLDRSTQAFGAYVDYVEDDVMESESPIMDSLYLQGGNRVLKTMMNFTQAKFVVLWSIVEGDLHSVPVLLRSISRHTDAL